MKDFFQERIQKFWKGGGGGGGTNQEKKAGSVMSDAYGEG